jgi:hypothetical protein
VVAECSPFAREKVAALMLKKGYLRQGLTLVHFLAQLERFYGIGVRVGVM